MEVDNDKCRLAELGFLWNVRTETSSCSYKGIELRRKV